LSFAVASARITPLGKTMAYFPVSPRYGKMLALGHQRDLLPYVVAIVAALSVQEVFIETMAPPTNDQEVWQLVGDSCPLNSTFTSTT
jgi:ATP-dependent RNA helicase DHX37/DHR1